MTQTPLSLTSAQREDRRRRAIDALAGGMTQKQVATLLGTSVASVSQWKSRFHRGGVEDLAAKRQGRPPRLASASSIDRVAACLLAGSPESQGLPFGLWDSAAVGLLIERVTGTRVSRWTVLRYLDAWRLAPPALPAPPAAWALAPRSTAAQVIVQSGRCSDNERPYWLLWARRSRGEWSVLAYPHPPSEADREAFVERLLILLPARLTLVAPPGDAQWTPSTLARCAARWPRRLSPVAADPAPTDPPRRTLLTPS